MRIGLFLVIALTPLLAFGPLVDVKWLHQHLGEKDLVVIDVTEDKFYQQGHIPEALHTSLSYWRQSKEEGWQVVDTKTVSEEFSRLGIRQKSKVVLYFHNEDPQGLLACIYVLWAMEYYGFTHTAILDGGMKAWRDFNGTISTIVSLEHNQSDFLPKSNANLIANMRYVAEHIGKSAMVDGRLTASYFGIEKEKEVQKRGHIPHAKSYHWRYSLEGDRFKKRVLLEEMLVKGLGFFSKRPIISYCNDGLEASVNFFVLHRLLGFEDVRLYDRSMREWGNSPESFMTKYRWE